MSNTQATILVNIDTSQGASAINYTPNSTTCPILGLNCISAGGTGSVKITPLRATQMILSATAGSGGRLRAVTGGLGNFTSVEIAAGGTGYPDGPVTVTLLDPYGTGGSIACTASGGSINSASIVTAGSGYSGYILFDVSNFIEGVTYDIVPMFIEQTTGVGVLKLAGMKLAYRPFQVF